MSLQKKISSLEHENSELKTRLKDVASIKGQQDIQAYMATNKVINKYINVFRNFSIEKLKAVLVSYTVNSFNEKLKQSNY